MKQQQTRTLRASPPAGGLCATAIYRDGGTVAFWGRTASELEAEADRLGIRAYRYPVEGGVVRVIRVGSQWVIL